MEITFPFEEIKISGSVELEVGCGNGEFLKFLAEQNRGINYIGIDISWESIKRASRRLRDLGNIRLVWGDAYAFLMFGAKYLKFQRVYSLFPDPWPKRRHEHKRLFSEDFWKLLSLRVIEDGWVWIVSDHLPSLLWYYDNALSSGCWYGYISEGRGSFETKYARKWKGMGKGIYEGVFQLIKPCDFTIPEITLRIPKIREIKNTSIVGDYKIGDFHLSIKEVFVSEGAVLIKGIISEGRLIHKVWFEVKKIGEVWKVEPSDFSRFYPTKALQLALDLIANELSR
jgi:tRNA (guanine-N7-)-methyltransferase